LLLGDGKGSQHLNFFQHFKVLFFDGAAPHAVALEPGRMNSMSSSCSYGSNSSSSSSVSFL